MMFGTEIDTTISFSLKNLEKQKILYEIENHANKNHGKILVNVCNVIRGAIYPNSNKNESEFPTLLRRIFVTRLFFN